MEEVIPGISIATVYVEDPEGLIPLLGAKLQAVRAPCYEVVIHAAILAKRAFERGTNHAKTLGGELLLRLGGTLQIREAIKKVGAGKGVNYLVLFGSPDELGDIIKGLNLREVPPVHCEKAEMKKYFEISALVEAL